MLGLAYACKSSYPRPNAWCQRLAGIATSAALQAPLCWLRLQVHRLHAVQRPPPDPDGQPAAKQRRTAPTPGSEPPKPSPSIGAKGGKDGLQGGDGDSGNSGKGGKGSEWFELKNNTSVYVTGIPDDATPEEVAEEFAKCGVVKTNDDGTPKVKLYRCTLFLFLQLHAEASVDHVALHIQRSRRDGVPCCMWLASAQEACCMCRDKETGITKGDGTVAFLLRPSVRLALTIMHGRPLRPGGAPDMSVTEAEFQMKGDFVANKKKQGGGGNKAGKGKNVPSQKDRLLSWSGFDDVHKASEVRAGLFDL
jgi:hypothetical protein